MLHAADTAFAHSCQLTLHRLWLSWGLQLLLARSFYLQKWLGFCRWEFRFRWKLLTFRCLDLRVTLPWEVLVWYNHCVWYPSFHARAKLGVCCEPPSVHPPALRH